MASAAPNASATPCAARNYRVDGDAEQLTFVGWAGVRSDSVIAVAQDQDRSVRFFRHDGSPLGMVGREGAGPGEFRRVRYLGWKGDTLWIWDNDLERLSFVSPDPLVVSRSVRITTFEPARGRREVLPSLSGPRPMALFPDGTMLLSGSPFDEPATYVSRGMPLFRANLEGELLDLVGWLPRSRRMAYTSRDGSSGSVLIPFSPDPLSGVSPHGDRIGLISFQKADDTGASFGLVVLDPRGDSIFAREYTAHSTRIPRAWRDSIIQDRASLRPEAGRALRNADIPEHYAPVRDLILGQERTTWIRLRHDAADTHSRWLMLDEHGEVTDTLLLPTSSRLMDGGTNFLLVRQSDSLDIHSLVLYRR